MLFALTSTKVLSALQSLSYRTSAIHLQTNQKIYLFKQQATISKTCQSTHKTSERLAMEDPMFRPYFPPPKKGIRINNKTRCRTNSLAPQNAVAGWCWTNSPDHTKSQLEEKSPRLVGSGPSFTLTQLAETGCTLTTPSVNLFLFKVTEKRKASHEKGPNPNISQARTFTWHTSQMLQVQHQTPHCSKQGVGVWFTQMRIIPKHQSNSTQSKTPVQFLHIRTLLQHHTTSVLASWSLSNTNI